MTDDSTTIVLKNAILLERRGKAFYKKAAENSSNAAIKEFFEMMCDEEARHIEILAERFKEYRETQRFSPAAYNDKHASNTDTKILTQKILQNISAAEFEAAAISAAIAMEERAVKIYAQRAEETTDPNEKALYVWLTDWEKDHLNTLITIDRELTETVWNDNNFWPF
jgi:rubrerythrin